MPKGPGTYGSQVGRPKKRKKKMNEQKLELVGESIWNTYKNIAYILTEVKSAKEQGKVAGKEAEKLRGQRLRKQFVGKAKKVGTKIVKTLGTEDPMHTGLDQA